MLLVNCSTSNNKEKIHPPCTGAYRVDLGDKPVGKHIILSGSGERPKQTIVHILVAGNLEARDYFISKEILRLSINVITCVESLHRCYRNNYTVDADFNTQQLVHISNNREILINWYFLKRFNIAHFILSVSVCSSNELYKAIDGV